jgi:hypothetical protein
MFQVGIACLSLWVPGFGFRVTHVGFVVDRWHRGRGFLCMCQFSCENHSTLNVVNYLCLPVLWHIITIENSVVTCYNFTQTIAL